MTDKLDEILEKVRYAAYYADYHANHTQEHINSIIAEHVAEQKQAILDWHNKQIEQAYSDGFQKASKGAFKSQQEAKREAVEAVLDRLLEHGEDFTTFGDGSRSVAVEYIEAERKKLLRE